MAEQITYSKQFAKGVYDHYFRLSQFERFTMVTEGLMSDPDQNSEMIFIVDVTNRLLDSLSINISTVLIFDEFREKARELINGFRSAEWLSDSISDKGV
jgi:hypothetical protein